MKTENFEAINKGLCYAEAQAEVLVMSGDHETAKDIILYLAKARAALYDEAR